MAASAPARLITIPISHYCEKARWALDRAAIAYREERHVQIIHRVASRRAGGGGTVPVLVARRGRVRAVGRHPRLRRSPHRAGRAPVPRGPRATRGGRRARARLRCRPRAARGGAGCTSTSSPSATSAARTTARASPRGSGARSRCCSASMSGYIRHLFAIGPETGERGRRGRAADVRRGRRAPGRRTALPVRRRLHGRRPRVRRPRRARPRPARSTASPLPQPDELPPDMAAAVRAFRAHPAGAFALRLFGEER